MYKILIVEDDNIIAEAVKEYLTSWDYDVKRATDYKNIISEFVEFAPQLVLLDISLPFYNGFFWCGEIRKLSKVPIVFISSASDNMSVIMAMNMGGDDFITKPFELDMLVAKIQAVMRRTYEFGTGSELLEHDGAVFDIAAGTLMYNGKTIELTKNESGIMRLLMQNKGRTVGRERIMTELWETDSYIDDNTLTVNMTRLRKKLEAAGLTDFIKTKKKLGYMIG